MDIGLGYLRDMIKSLFIANFTVLKRAFFSSDLPTVHPHKKTLYNLKHILPNVLFS